MRNRWFHVPSIHCPGHGQEKKVGWLELFYDLIFVATFIQLGNALSQNISVSGVLIFVGLMLPLWLTWTAFTLYSNRFEVDDLLHRGLVFVQMFAIGGLAISVSGVFEGSIAQFSLFFAGGRAVTVLLYLRTYWQQPQARVMTSRYAGGYSIGVLLWLCAGFLPMRWAIVCWTIAIGVDLVLPMTRARSIESRFPPDALHLSERFGLFTLIVLGESFVKVLTSLSEHGADGNHALSGGMALGIVCSLWWLYFDDVAGSRIKKSGLAVLVWTYVHLPMTIGIVATGIAIKKAVFFDLTTVAPEGYRWLLCSSLALVLLSVAAIDSVTERRQSEFADRTRTITRFASGLVMLLLAPTGSFMPSWVFLGLCLLVCLTQVLFDLITAPLLANEEMLKEGAQDAFGVGDLEESERQVKPTKSPSLSTAIRKGTPSELRRDLYFYLIESSWTVVFAFLLFVFLLSNGIFASLYLLDENAITNGGGENFSDAFFFSVQTMSTIGYGTLSPGTDYANMLVTCEAIIGLFGTALATGLMFAKASRPASSVLFSKNVLITTFHGKPTLMFRAGNARGNEIVEATISVSALVDETSKEGHTMRRLQDVKLERTTTPLFMLTWQLLHVIDEDSPFFGLTQETIAERIGVIIVVMTGHDTTYGQTVHSRIIYSPEDVLFNRRFVDVLSNLDGRLMVDYDKFHSTVPES